jgi:hypothetical protein
MAHFAEIDKDNKVLRVVVVSNEFEDDGQNYLANVVGLGGTWIQTSYNGNFRGVYAGIDYIYNKEEDIFVTPQRYPSWTRDGSNWVPPVPMPIEKGKVFDWDEATLSWVEVKK